jgi:membrane protease YdiL (CAAX protease family)
MGKWPAFATLALPAAVISPVGEEFFFRGLFHFSIKRVAGNTAAIVANAFAFGSVHLLHHGISKDAAGLHLRLGSGLVWLLATAGLGWALTVCRVRSGSLWPAILAHSASTLVMNLTIFTLLI